MFRNYCFIVLSALAAFACQPEAFAQEEIGAENASKEVVVAQEAVAEHAAAVPSGFCCPKPCSEVNWSGFLEAGILCNTYGAHSNGYTSSTTHNGGAFDALYISGTKEASTDGFGTDWGFKADFMFGDNARFMQTTDGWDENWDTSSDDIYGFSIPQLYGEIAINEWSFLAGHFYTHIGYECIPGNERFFYSRGIAFDNVPGSHTGFQVKYNGFENLDVMVGWSNGHDIGFTDNGGSYFIGSFAYHVNECTTLTYGVCAGDEYDFMEEDEFGDTVRVHGYGSIHSVVLDCNLSERTNWVTEFDYWSYQESDFEMMTIGEHLYYTVNECWKWGTRIEWLKNNSYGAGTDERLFAMTVGANWTPCPNSNLIIRPELRYDKLLSEGTAFGKYGEKDDQITLGFDLIYNF